MSRAVVTRSVGSALPDMASGQQSLDFNPQWRGTGVYNSQAGTPPTTPCSYSHAKVDPACIWQGCSPCDRASAPEPLARLQTPLPGGCLWGHPSVVTGWNRENMGSSGSSSWLGQCPCDSAGRTSMA